MLETAWEFESPPGHFTFFGDSKAQLIPKPQANSKVGASEADRADDWGNTSFEAVLNQLYFTRFPIN